MRGFSPVIPITWRAGVIGVGRGGPRGLGWSPMPPPRLPLIAALLLCACPTPPRLAPQAPAEVWVDGTRGVPGNGSRGRPYRTLEEALAGEQARPLRVHLAVGLHQGPFTLPEGVELEGAGEATVVHAEGREATVVRLPAGGTLRRLVLQGGGWGLEGTGAVRLEQVHFSGQRQGSARQSSGRLVVEGGHFEAGVSETVGLALEGSVGVELRDTTFGGPYRRAVQVRGEAEVALEGVRFSGPVTAVHQVGGQVRAEQVQVEGGRGPALFSAQGSLRLEQVSVQGHEYGLQVREAALQVRGFTSVRAARAGLGLVGARGRLEEVVVRHSGDFGGVQLVGSELELHGLRVEDTAASAVSALQGTLRLERASLVRVGGGEGGHGLELRQVRAKARGVVVQGASGVGVLGAQDAQVVLEDVVLQGCQQGGVVVDRLGHITAVGLEVSGSGGPVLLALGQGRLSVESLRLRGPAQELLLAQCEAGARVQLGKVESEQQPVPIVAPDLPCVVRPR